MGTRTVARSFPRLLRGIFQQHDDPFKNIMGHLAFIDDWFCQGHGLIDARVCEDKYSVTRLLGTHSEGFETHGRTLSLQCAWPGNAHVGARAAGNAVPSSAFFPTTNMM